MDVALGWVVTTARFSPVTRSDISRPQMIAGACTSAFLPVPELNWIHLVQKRSPHCDVPCYPPVKVHCAVVVDAVTTGIHSQAGDDHLEASGHARFSTQLTRRRGPEAHSFHLIPSSPRPPGTHPSPSLSTRSIFLLPLFFPHSSTSHNFEIIFIHQNRNHVCPRLLRHCQAGQRRMPSLMNCRELTG